MNRREAIAVGAAVVGLSSCAEELEIESFKSDQKQGLLSANAVNLESWNVDLSFKPRSDKATRDNFSFAILTGHRNVEGVSKADSLKAYQDDIASVALIFEDAKVFAAIDPFNPYEHPRHFIYSSADAA